MERQYLFTERAHLMCPGMCFGVAGLIPVPGRFAGRLIYWPRRIRFCGR